MLGKRLLTEMKNPTDMKIANNNKSQKPMNSIYKLLDQLQNTEFVETHFDACVRVQRKLTDQIERVKQLRYQRIIDAEYDQFYFESIERKCQRAKNQNNWIQEQLENGHQPGLCYNSSDSFPEDCFYGDCPDKYMNDFQLFRFPGTYIRLCDRCLKSLLANEMYCRLVNMYIGVDIFIKNHYDAKTLYDNGDGVDMRLYESETNDELLKRAKDNTQWNVTRMTKCSLVCINSGFRQLYGTSICLCQSCFENPDQRLKISK